MIGLAVDQSTSATKALLVGADGRVLASAARPHVQHYPQVGFVEHDADEIWNNVRAVVRDLVPRFAEHRPAFVSIANQRETVVVFDRLSGQPLRPAIVWQCTRGADICRELIERGLGGLIQSRTGLRTNPYFSGSKLLWIMRHEPETAEAIRSGRAVVGTVDSYLIHRMTQGSVFATDATNASRTLLFDIQRRQWDPVLAEIFETPTTALAEVRDADAEFGRTDFGGILPEPIPIRGVLGDSQASLLAQRCLSVGDAKATLGTGSSLLVNVGNEPPPTEGPAVVSIAWVLRGQPTYALEGITNTSAAVLTWLRDQLGLITDLSEATEAARSLDGNDGVFLVPAFTGMGSPWWQPEARAAIVGMSLGTDRRHILRAALESIAFQVRDQLASIETSTSVRVRALNVDGGATANAWLMQFLADVCAVPLVLGEDANASALGAWSAGVLGMDPGRSPDELPPWGGEVVAPLMRNERADELWHGWLKAVQAVVAMSRP